MFKKRTYGKAQVFQWLLTLVACIVGGGAMAVAPPPYADPSDMVEPQIGNEGPAVNTAAATSPTNPGSDHDPVDANVSDRITPGGSTAGQDLTGTQMSSTQLTKGGLVEDEWDANIVRFKPFRNPLLTLVRVLSKTQKISNWTVNHMRVGGETLEVVTTQALSDASTPVDMITLTTSNCRGSLRPFYKGSTVFALGVPGYAPGSQTVQEGELMLFVVDSTKNSATLMAVNGPARSANVIGDELDSVKIPLIPAGTILSCGATAAGESQLMISPENFQPRPFDVYVQKKLLNIVTTEDFDAVKKKQPLKVSDVKADALYKYNMRAERTYWRGIRRRFNVQNADGSVEFAYTSEGVLWQLTNSYAIDSDYTLNDLIAISKLQFTDFAENNRAYVFCGKDAMASLLNINPGTNRHIVFEDTRVKNIDLEFKSFRTTFGTLNFIWDQTLDMLHMADCMVVLDIEGAVRYVKMGEKEQTNDMSRGAGEIRAAHRFIHYEADAVALRGFNSILVGPKDRIFSMPQTKNMNKIISSDSLPDVPADGMLIALTEDYTVDDVTYTAGTVYKYVEEDSTGWVEYTGLTVAG